MNTTSKPLEETAAFIREHRSNEAAFEKLYARLAEEARAASGGVYKNNLLEVKEKAASAYRKAKEINGAAWPEFEKFVTGFEKAVLQAAHP